MTKRIKTVPSLRRTSSPSTKNNQSAKSQSNQATDEQLAQDLFAAPKPQVVVPPLRTAPLREPTPS